MRTDILPKKRRGRRRRKHALNSLSMFNLFLHMGINEGVGVSWKITDMRDILQYTINGAAGKWMKQRSIQKATSAAVNKFISPLPMQDVI
jgi:hypothetical protein